MISIQYAEIPSGIGSRELFETAASAFCNPENREYLAEIMSRKNEESKKESLTALILLSKLLQSADTDPESVILTRESEGKPCFKNSSLHFSLTHSKGFAAAALSDSSRIGLDMECSHVVPDKAEKLAQRFFDTDELESFYKNKEDFLLIWTKKEALAKMHGRGLSSAISPKDAASTLSKKAVFSSYIINGFPLSVCTENESEKVCVSKTTVNNQ